MKKEGLFILLIWPLLVSAALPDLESAKNMASRVYTKVDKTVTDKVNKVTKDDFINMYGLDSKGKPLYLAVKYANDLYMLNVSGVKKDVLPQEYFFDIEDFVNEKSNVAFNYKIIGAEITKQPELRKNEDEPEFAIVHVRKEWVVDGVTTRINDNVCVNLKLNHIASIRGEKERLQDIPEETLEGMLAKAAGLYNSKQYGDAAALYKRIVDKYPSNDDAWYYLGVMYFKMEGVGKLSQKQRLQKAYECWKKSNLSKARRAISYITDGRE